MSEAPLTFSSPPRPKAPSRDRPHVVLLDGNNLAARSFHAAKHRLTSADGVETGSLHLFCTGLSRYLKELRPTHFVVCWDGGRSVHREKMFSDYKLARRKAQEGEPPHGPAFALITEFLDLTGIEQWFEPGVEADDLIAAWHRRTREEMPEAHITILSSDKDLLQLLDDRTHQWRFSSSGTPTDVWDREKVIRDLGYVPERIPLVMALTGDVSDGVPGAKGIGPVKAVKLLEAHDWDLDKVAASRPDGVMIKLSHRLVDLRGELCTTVPPVPVYEPLGPTSRNARERLEHFTEFCARYQLRELWDRVAIHRDLWW